MRRFEPSSHRNIQRRQALDKKFRKIGCFGRNVVDVTDDDDEEEDDFYRHSSFCQVEERSRLRLNGTDSLGRGVRIAWR